MKVVLLFEMRGETMAKRKWSEEEITNYRRQRIMYFYYYNEEDGNLFVPKAYVLVAFKNSPMARLTFNWAHPVAMTFALGILTLILLPIIFNILW